MMVPGALPKKLHHWSLTTIREKLVKIKAKVAAHGQDVTFQIAKGEMRKRPKSAASATRPRFGG